MQQLSYNKASTFRNCPKKYYWRYVEHLSPIIKSPTLSLGAILHEGFDMFYKGFGDQEVYQHIAKKFDEEIAKEETADREDILINKYIALGMWWSYPYKNVKYDVVASEEEFSVDLCDGWKFIGKVDGRLLHYGNWWVRELKTTGVNQRQFEGRCQTSAQGTGYVFGLSEKYPVKGILYEYIKKPILRKGVKENADQFGRRIMQDYKDRPKAYYNHYLSYRSPVDIKNFKDDTILVARLIENTQSFHRNMESCWSFNSECPYLKICMAEKPDQLTLDLYFNRKEVKNGE